MKSERGVEGRRAEKLHKTIREGPEVIDVVNMVVLAVMTTVALGCSSSTSSTYSCR